MKMSLSAVSDDQLHQNAARKLNGNGNGGRYGSREFAKEVKATSERKIVIPPLDVPSYRATAITSGRGGEPIVRDTSTRAFLAGNAELVEECHELIDQLDAEKRGRSPRRWMKQTGMCIRPEAAYPGHPPPG
jgi:hypothetical protein